MQRNPTPAPLPALVPPARTGRDFWLALAFSFAWGMALPLAAAAAVIWLPPVQRLLLAATPVPGFSVGERWMATRHLLDYFSTRDGSNLTGYTPDEQAHLAEVAGVMRTLRWVLVATLLTAVATGYLINQRHGWHRLRPILRRTSGVTAVVSLAFLIIGWIGFSALFEEFHRLVFSAAPWAFDPAVSRLVNVYPPEYFRAAFTLILLTTVLAGGGGWLLLRRGQRKTRG